MRGRKPKPTRLKIMEGNPGKRPLPEGEPLPPAAIPDRPDHLDADAAARWDWIAPKLAALGILAEIDRDMLGVYCQAVADLARYTRLQRYFEGKALVPTAGADGLDGLVPDRDMQKLAAHYRGAANTAEARMKSAASEFGMSPAARTRIKATPPTGEKSELAAFLAENA